MFTVTVWKSHLETKRTMLNSRVFAYGNFFFTLCGYFGAIPYTWDHENQQLKKCKTAKRKSTYALSGTILWILFVIEEAIRFYQLKDFKSFNICYMFLMATAVTMLSISIMVWPNDGGLQMFNVLLNFCKDVGKQINMHRLFKKSFH